MRCSIAQRPAARIAGAVLVACGCGAAQAQGFSPNYTLTAPALLAAPDVGAARSLAAWGPLRLSAGPSGSGNGLSVEAGRSWFARAGIGRSVDADELSLGGGYRFPDGALSMAVTRQLGQERLGLAVRYDWRQAWLRLTYEQPTRTPGATPDRLRFSAGVQF